MTAITICGNLTGDPETTGKTCSFTVAVSERSPDETGRWTETGIAFFACTAAGKLAANIAASLRKGDRVIVVGKLRQDHKTWVLVAEDVGPSMKFDRVNVGRNPGKETPPW